MVRPARSSGTAATRLPRGITSAALPSPTGARTSAPLTGCSTPLVSDRSRMQMRAHRVVPLFAASLIAGGVTFAQVGRCWSDWPTPYADAQRTSWLRTDPNISVESMSKPGFELQWTSKLDNQRRGLHGLTQGVTASGVTLFVPASIVAGSSNKLYMLDNDTGYVIWSRTFEGTLPAPSVACSGGVPSAPTRIVSGAAPTAPDAVAPPPAGRANQP